MCCPVGLCVSSFSILMEGGELLAGMGVWLLTISLVSKYLDLPLLVICHVLMYTVVYVCHPHQVKTRIVYVKGQPVLRSNMYDLEDGEPSVFDKELNSECCTRGRGWGLTLQARQAAHKIYMSVCGRERKSVLMYCPSLFLGAHPVQYLWSGSRFKCFS